MEIEPRSGQSDRPVTQADREAAAETLQRAVGDSRLELAAFSERVGMVWAADTHDELANATSDLPAESPVGSTPTVSSVVSFLGDRKQVGRWRLPDRLRVLGLLGDVYLDLRGVVVTDDVVEISAVTFLGNLCVDVPEGVEVELTGFDVLGDRELRLAPVQRRAGTPLIRIRAYGLLGDVTVRTPETGEKPPSWWR